MLSNVKPFKPFRWKSVYGRDISCDVVALFCLLILPVTLLRGIVYHLHIINYFFNSTESMSSGQYLTANRYTPFDIFLLILIKDRLRALTVNFFSIFISLIDFHPSHGKDIIVLSPCSGHGFKVHFPFIFMRFQRFSFSFSVFYLFLSNWYFLFARKQFQFYSVLSTH